MIFDAHADILTDMFDQSQKNNLNSFKKRHLKRYKKAGITHSIFVNWTNPKTSDSHLFKKIFDNAFIELESNNDIFKICTNYQDMIDSYNESKIGVVIGMEGVMQLQSIKQLEDLYQRGVRHASLTWNEVNKYAAGLSSETEGLTLLGKELVQKMEELGMIIDLAHSNPRTFNEIFDATSKPLIISHGNIKTLCNHIRNYTDDQLLKLKDRDGVIGICGIGPFIAEKQEDWTVSNMAKHIDYAVKLIGIDHVGIGFDVCYYLSNEVSDNKVEGFKHIDDAPNLFTELIKMGYTKEDLNKIKYDNFARIVKKILK